MCALAVQRLGANGLANPTLRAARRTSCDVTQAPLKEYPGVVRGDDVNGESAADGTTFSAR